MLLTLSTSMPDATDLGFLLHKHPGRAQSFDVAVGTAHVVWPEATSERSTVALLLEVDPIALVRGGGGRGRGGGGDTGFSLSEYVNDRPYAASSMMSVALGKVFGTAMSGRCDARPELAAAAVPLEVHVPALACRGVADRSGPGQAGADQPGADLVRRLFAPLGWSVTTTAIALDEQLPSWGDSPYVDLRLSATMPVSRALQQLYVLIPVLDDSKHYWVSTDEVDKLLRAGGTWLAGHPEREVITSRYLGHHRSLVRDATSRLAELDDVPGDAGTDDPGTDDAVTDGPVTGGAVADGAVTGGGAAAGVEGSAPRPTSMAQLRAAAVLAALREQGARTVVDLGCGEGALLRALLADPAFTEVVGADVSHRALETAARRLDLDRLSDTQRGRLQLIQSSATYRDDRLAGHDAVVLMEVVEHVDPPRLPALVRSVFHHARPTSVLVTTPNADHNVRYPSLPAGAMRHRDHRFEWTRQEFADWSSVVATAHGYTVRHLPVGDDDPDVGAPTQLAVFRRTA